jgi:hypothetical protein
MYERCRATTDGIGGTCLRGPIIAACRPSSGGILLIARPDQEGHTRQVALAGFAIMAIALATTCASRAQNYAWCLVNDLKFGSTNCAFVSREQCMMSTGGNVGHCIANPAYSPAPERRAGRPLRQR